MSPDLSSEMRVLTSALGRHLFVVDGSRIYDLPPDTNTDPASLRALLPEIAPPSTRRIDGTPLAPPPLQTVSLNLAQACNMSCGYCYADGGAFQGRSRLMPAAVARAAVDRLIEESSPGADLVVGFMGGEPLLHRSLLHEIVPYAEAAAAAAGRTVRFSLTTNATLIQPDDARLFVDHAFQVAVSLDGPPALNDRQRSLMGGGGSYRRVCAGLACLLAAGRPRHLSLRATVTPMTTDLPAVLDHLIGLGVDSVGFAAVLSSPDPKLAFRASDFERFLDQMKACADRAKDHILAGRRYPFSNFETALSELERGSHRPYPCGAGAAYLSVNAEGQFYACHRLLDDPAHHLGDVKTGSDVAARRLHLVQAHVDRQEPCGSCWARYLCGGGCYHEVERRGRIACDYIRGWLEHCIAAYVEIKEKAPGYFDHPGRFFAEGSLPEVSRE
jgi:uncharacterized protein